MESNLDDEKDDVRERRNREIKEKGTEFFKEKKIKNPKDYNRGKIKTALRDLSKGNMDFEDFELNE